MHSSRHAIKLPAAYDLKRSLALLTMSRSDPALRLNTDSVEWVLKLPDGLVHLQGQRKEHVLDVILNGSHAASLEPHLPRLFGLEDAAHDFQPTGPLGQHVKRFPGIHLPRLPDVFHRLIQIVLQQLVSWEDAASGWARMVRRYGTPAPGETNLFAPPAAETLQSLGYYDLVGCGILPKQARLILQLAAQHRRIQRAAAQSDETLCQYLNTIPGVGTWTIDYLRGTALGHSDAVLTGDYALPHTVSWFFQRQARSHDEEMLELLKPFPGHRFRVQHLLMVTSVRAPRRGPKMATNRRRFRL